MEKWTREDQAEYEKLAEKRKRTLERDEGELLQVAKQIVRSLYVGTTGAPPPGYAERVAEALRANCGTVRDALEPFDDGVRFVEPG